MLSVVERFVSINGEGAHAGELAAFIRFRGCNLGCSYCDTKWANRSEAHAMEYTPERLANWVADKHVANVTLTERQGNRVEIETNGSMQLDSLAKAERRPVFTMDYKLPGSGMEAAMRRDNFRLLGKHDTVKFVAGSLTDLERAREIIEHYQLESRCHVYLSPVYGKINPADMVRFMIDNDMIKTRLQLQLHKFIWSPEKRGV